MAHWRVSSKSLPPDRKSHRLLSHCHHRSVFRVHLNHQIEFRRLQLLSFCYLCGEQFDDGQNKDRDHVPPKAIFLRPDRNHPLILPTHTQCNNAESVDDEHMSQLVSMIHGKQPDTKNDKRKLGIIEVPGQGSIRCFGEIDMRSVIFRWIRGFHAALYNQHLPKMSTRSILPPWPTAKIISARVVKPDRITDQYPRFVEALRKSRIAHAFDSIVCNNKKLHYYCSWSELDNGMPFCIFALDLYGWIKLGATAAFPARSCVGAYALASDFPVTATRATNLEFAVVSAGCELDAFADV